MGDAIHTIAEVAQISAKARAAAAREADGTLAALREAMGGVLPEPMPFTAEHVRALVFSAFMAGILHEAERRDGRRGSRALEGLN